MELFDITMKSEKIRINMQITKRIYNEGQFKQFCFCSTRSTTTVMLLNRLPWPHDGPILLMQPEAQTTTRGLLAVSAGDLEIAQ